MSQKCYNFVAKFINNMNMEEKKSDLIEGLKEYLDNASKEELDELEKYNQFGPVVNISEYYSRANNMDMKQRREAFKLAFEWIRNIPLCDCDIDLATAYAEGVIYGWNNPNWIPVENKLPPENGKTQQSIAVWATDGLTSGEFRYNFDTKTWTDIWGDPFDITHWISRPQLPRKEE